MIEIPDPTLQRARILQTISYIFFALALLVLAGEAFVERDERVLQGVLLLICWVLLIVSFLVRFRADHHHRLAFPELHQRPKSAVESQQFLYLQRRTKKLRTIAIISFALALGGSAAKLFVPLEQMLMHSVIEGATFTAFFVGMMVAVLGRHYRRLAEY